MTPIQNPPPLGLSVESEGTNLAALSMTPAMRQIADVIVRQWSAVKQFRPLARHGIYPIRQLLFHGPPGNGKTFACQWIAQQLRVPLYRVRCEQVVGSLLGQTTSNIGAVLTWVKEQPPAIVLFDEVETLFPARRAGGDSCSRELNSAMTVYWQHLDRWETQHLFVMATNMPAALDDALKSRIEMQLEFGPPTEAQAREVINYWAEVLNQYGADQWRPKIEERLDTGNRYASFRELWQTIQQATVAYVTDSLGAES
ncbi:MAG: ATP-binding protein [Planctomycetota bacterium]